MEIHERLAIFYRRLQSAPPVRTQSEAFELICAVMEQVEVEFCAVPKKSLPPRDFDGRMYSPQSDNISVRPDGSWWVKTRRHRIAIHADGSFVIYYIKTPYELIEQFRKAVV